MSKIVKNLLIIAIVLCLALGFIMFKNNKKKKSYVIGNKVINHPNVVELKNINTIKDKVQNNDKFILYIGNSICSDCGDFYNNPFQEILKNNPDQKFYYVDFYSREQYPGNWEKVIGRKNDAQSDKEFYSPVIKNFAFYFTPTIVFIKDQEAKYVFSGYGGGAEYSTRYFRDNPSMQKQGRQNAIEDVQNLIDKWK